jgi:hypothetical protein
VPCSVRQHRRGLVPGRSGQRSRLKQRGPSEARPASGSSRSWSATAAWRGSWVALRSRGTTKAHRSEHNQEKAQKSMRSMRRDGHHRRGKPPRRSSTTPNNQWHTTSSQSYGPRQWASLIVLPRAATAFLARRTSTHRRSKTELHPVRVASCSATRSFGNRRVEDRQGARRRYAPHEPGASRKREDSPKDEYRLESFDLGLHRVHLSVWPTYRRSAAGARGSEATDKPSAATHSWAAGGSVLDEVSY